MASVGFSIPNNLDYSRPTKDIPLKSNQVSFKPISGSTFSGDGDANIKINVSSNSQFWDISKSYLKFKVQFSGTKATSHKLPLAGYGYLINQVDTYCGGILVESLNDYNKMVANNYKHLPSEYLNTLKALEQYNNATGSVVNGICTADSGVTVCHAIRNTFETCPKAIPLMFIRGGVQYEIKLETMARFLATNTDAGLTSYTVSEVEYVACLFEPEAAVIKQYNDSFKNGGVAQFPLRITKCIKNVPVNASQQQYTLQLGYHKSLEEINCLTHSNVLGISGGTTGNDSSNNFTHNGVTKYRFEIGGERYPRNFDIQMIGSTAGGSISAENVMQKLISQDNTFPFLNHQTGSPIDTVGNSIYYCFKNNSFGSGIPISDGIVTAAVEGTPSSTSVINYWYVTLSALLKISADNVELDTKSLD